MDPETPHAPEPETRTTAREPVPVPERPIGPYKPVKQLGHGGMGIVYLAVRADDQYQKRVAIKVIKAGMDGAEVVRHFRRERQILAGLDHPNIARLLDGGTTEEGLPYLVMEYIQGQPLHEYCDGHRLPIAERLEVFRQVCAAVAYAHRNLVVHRDLKPSNILVTAEGVPRLLDFGIAKLLNPELSAEAPTATGLAMTPEYASPEQARGEVVTTATDVYSLGVLLYELLTGQRPYRLKTHQPLEVLKAVCEEEPEKPSTAVGRKDVTSGAGATFVNAEELSKTRESTPEKLRRRLSGDLDNIVLMALRKEPQRRYASVEALSEDIRRYLEGRPVMARKGTAAYRAGKYIRRHALGVTAVAAFILLLIGFAVTMTVQSTRLARERDVAAKERDKAERVSTFLVDLFSVSDPSEARGNTITAREILDKGASKIAGELKEQPAIKAALMDTMGRVYRALGLYHKARALTEEALALRRKALGSDHADVGRSLDDLARILDDEGDYAGAEALYREALAMQRKLLGSDHPDIAQSLLGLANALEGKGDYAGAATLHREALTMRRKLLGNEHPDVARSLMGVANALLAQGDYAGAEAYNREALAMQRKLLGHEHPDVASTLNNLAGVLYDEGDYGEAEALYGEALEMERKLLGKEHPVVATALGNLAIVVQAKGDYARAEALYREALEMNRNLVGNENPAVARGLGYLASVLQVEGDYPRCETLYREALAMQRKLLGNEHPDVALTLDSLADLLTDKGDPVGAEALEREALAMNRKLFGGEHPYLADNLSTLGQALRDQGRLAEAEQTLRRSLEIRRKALPPDHIEIAAVLIRLGDALNAEGQPQNAEPLLRQGLEIRQKKLPKDHPSVAGAESELAACLILLRRFDEAEALLLEAYPVLRSKTRASRPTREARQRLVDLYQAWGKPDKAARYRQI